ncbi:MAG: aminofutalosine synthase MqnE [Acidobacteria bacterium]|nr:aminofutalosine synthase MqnE [Acidobacteriota bacterium]
MKFADDFLIEIDNKVGKGERISKSEALRLFETNDLTGLGRVAGRANSMKNGDRVFFNINRHVNPSNLCTNHCQFCAFYRKSADEPGAYEQTVPGILEKLKGDVAAGATEVHIVGGLHPTWRFEEYVEIVREIHRHYPALHIKAFTCVEIDHFAGISGKSLTEVFEILKDAGLGSMPGGGAEVFSPRVRKKLCAKKISGERWLEVARAAHHSGLKSNATLLYGHIETVEERIDHLSKLRQLQDETGGFQAFIPLSWHKEGTELERVLNIPGATGLEDLKMIAVSRIFLDNFDHIKAYWVMLGKKLAQTALWFGADDLDGTVADERVTFMAGGKTDRFATIDEIIHLIRSAGKVPVERNTLYEPLKIC